MKYVITALFTTLLSLPAFAGEMDLSQTENDIKLIRANLNPNASDKTLRSVDILTTQTVEDLSQLLSQNDTAPKKQEKAKALWNKLETILTTSTIDVEQRFSGADYDNQDTIREQVDTKAEAINFFYQHELRSNPMLGGRIVVELNFLPTGYLGDIEIKSADEGMESLARRILPLLRTVRVKPQEAPQTIEYKLNFFPSKP